MSTLQFTYVSNKNTTYNLSATLDGTFISDLFIDGSSLKKIIMEEINKSTKVKSKNVRIFLGKEEQRTLGSFMYSVATLKNNQPEITVLAPRLHINRKKSKLLLEKKL